MVLTGNAMSLAPLIVVTILYAIQAAIFLVQRDWAAFAILAGYAFANVGLVWKLL